jgi:hypothetical protein
VHTNKIRYYAGIDKRNKKKCKKIKDKHPDEGAKVGAPM